MVIVHKCVQFMTFCKSKFSKFNKIMPTVLKRMKEITAFHLEYKFDKSTVEDFIELQHLYAKEAKLPYKFCCIESAILQCWFVMLWKKLKCLGKMQLGCLHKLTKQPKDFKKVLQIVVGKHLLITNVCRWIINNKDVQLNRKQQLEKW